MTESHLDALDLILEQFRAAVSPFHLCPPSLFAELVRVNHLRARATTCDSSARGSLSHEAYEILGRIHAFSSAQWADSKPLSRESWMLVGNAYQSAVALYCISSLQSLSVLPQIPSLTALCATHSHGLQHLLSQALPSPQTKRFILWPLVILGVQAVNASAQMRTFVAESLPDLSRYIGTCSPLTAKHALELFWASGETRWDACFDRPYAFVTQIAVDVSGIM